ncbi:hypothetical protein HYW87_04630, partial [Candidatus Roizmanbacteria bacterium]|nr:hypothetical protein [Candidatus Roizmanbacteria bacterium]
MFLNKRVLNLVFIFIIVIYFFQHFRVSRNYSQTYTFGDENAHMAGGYFVLKGYKPYKDFSGNHQPLTYIFPAAIQRAIPANSLYLFVGRHRLAVYLYSIFWQSVYLFTFGKFIFFFTLIFEITRYVLLGNKVLGETWAMYPLVFLLGIAIKKAIFNKNLKNHEIILFSLASFVSAFSLLPVWPSVIVLNALLLIKHLREKQ